MEIVRLYWRWAWFAGAGKRGTGGAGRWGRCDTGEEVTISGTRSWQVCVEMDCLVLQTVAVVVPLRARP